MLHLYAESFAPWCEKARWALDHHGIPYRYTEHVPMIGELRLRLAARRLRGRVTVPLLVHGRDVLMGSVAIARFAERVRQRNDASRSTPLFPVGREADLETWNARSESVMTSGRAMLLARLLRSPAALREQLPSFIPKALRPVLQPLASSGVHFLARKYGVRFGEDATHLTRARAALDSLRAALEGGRAWLLDGFSFADITMATSLQFILPVADRYMSLGPGTREAWTHPTIASEYADLLAWRDGVYTARRRPEERVEASGAEVA
ncbi:MAG: glutathione S-transferase N-terminal domain-containing protein [Myxococcaceae bacterium]